jgi:hypothetical protein
VKKDIAKYLAKCIECQQVKAEHRHPTGLLQPLPISEWKWETISMEFITGIPTSTKQNDAIMVVVDKLSKATHFISVKLTCKAIKLHLNIAHFDKCRKCRMILSTVVSVACSLQLSQVSQVVHKCRKCCSSILP